MTKVTEELWFTEPFEWYEQNRSARIGLGISNKYSLDFMEVLLDIHNTFREGKTEQGLDDCKALATLLIASRLGKQDEVIEEMMVLSLNDEVNSLIIGEEDSHA